MATLAETYLPLTTKLVNEQNHGLTAVNVSGTEYAVRDSNARSAISGIITTVDSLVAGGVKYVGKSEDNQLSDGSTVSAIAVIGKTGYEAAQGDLVIKDSGTGGKPSEFIWNGQQWSEFGAGSALKALAFKDTATGEVDVTGGTSEEGDFTVDFSNATPTPGLGTLGATFSGVEATGLTGTFTGTPVTLSNTVATEDTDLTVQFLNASVNVITSVSSDAIASIPSLSTSDGSLGSLTVEGATGQFDRVTSVKSGTLTNATGFSGESTTFSGTYTPSGSITSGTDNFVTDVGIGTIKSAGSVGWNSSIPTGTVSKPDVTVTPSSGAFFNGATVTNEVLSFSSGDALTSATAALADTPTFTGTGFSGTLSFSGDTPTGDFGLTSGAALTSAGFSGSNSIVSAAGVPLGSLTTTSVTYLSAAETESGAVELTASGSSSTKFLTGVAYNGVPTAATITSGKSDVTATGTQTLTYKKPTTVSISYTPSGSVTMQDYTPSGTVTLSGVPSVTIAGTQYFSGHSHYVNAEGEVTVS